MHILTHTIYTHLRRPCLASQPPWTTSLSHLPCNCKIMPLKRYDISPSLVVANFSSKASRRSSAQSRSSHKSSFLPHSAWGWPLWGVSRGCSLGAGFLDRAEKETKNDFSSLPPTLGPFSAEAKSWYSLTQGVLYGTSCLMLKNVIPNTWRANSLRLPLNLLFIPATSC